MSAQPTLLAVPNVSEGRDTAVLAAIGEAFVAAGAKLLDVHSDADHHRTVYTLAGRPGELAHALLAGAGEALARIDISDGRGAHPHVGAIDVAPIVHVSRETRGAAVAEALLLGDLLGERLSLPVFLYGAMGGGVTRAELRRGGAVALAARVDAGELSPDFGPRTLDPRVGAVLVAARPPLVAFNLELAPPAGISDARAIAARIREGGEDGLRGVRAIGVELARSRALADETADQRGQSRSQTTDDPGSGLETSPRPTQTTDDPGSRLETSAQRAPTAEAVPAGPVGQVSINVEDPFAVPLRDVLAAVEEAAKQLGVRVAVGELVGLAPAVALQRFPDRVPLVGFDRKRHVIESALAAIDRPDAG